MIIYPINHLAGFTGALTYFAKTIRRVPQVITVTSGVAPVTDLTGIGGPVMGWDTISDFFDPDKIGIDEINKILPQ